MKSEEWFEFRGSRYTKPRVSVRSEHTVLPDTLVPRSIESLCCIQPGDADGAIVTNIPRQRIGDPACIRVVHDNTPRIQLCPSKKQSCCTENELRI